jgi:hypothetical protein
MTADLVAGVPAMRMAPFERVGDATRLGKVDQLAETQWRERMQRMQRMQRTDSLRLGLITSVSFPCERDDVPFESPFHTCFSLSRS